MNEEEKQEQGNAVPEPSGEGGREFRLPADPEALAEAIRRMLNGERE